LQVCRLVLQQEGAAIVQQTTVTFSGVKLYFCSMNWKKLDSTEQIQNIKEKSFQHPQVIFKHSTRCGTSSMVKSRLERSEPITGVEFYYLDLIVYRDVSNRVAEEFNVYHESPQVLLIVNGNCVYDESHLGISMDELEDQVKSSVN